jgi:hypothetical protein
LGLMRGNFPLASLLESILNGAGHNWHD